MKITLAVLLISTALSSAAPLAWSAPARSDLELEHIVVSGDSAAYASLTTHDHQRIQDAILKHLSAPEKKQYWFKTILNETKVAFKDDRSDLVPSLGVACGSLPSALSVKTNPPGPGVASSNELPSDALLSCRALEHNADGSLCLRAIASKVTAAQIEGDFTKVLTSFDKGDYRTMAVELGTYSKDCASLFPDADAFLAGAITNYHVIDAGQDLRGARPKDSGLDALAATGVKTIIDLQGGDLENTAVAPFVRLTEPGESPDAIAEEKAHATSLGMTFYSVPLNSMRTASEKERAEILRVLAIMSDPKAQPVYIHCEHGADRTGLIAALFRVAHDKWPAKKAHDEMIKDGHSGFFDHLVTGAMDETFKQMLPLVQSAVAAHRLNGRAISEVAEVHCRSQSRL